MTSQQLSSVEYGGLENASWFMLVPVDTATSSSKLLSGISAVGLWIARQLGVPEPTEEERQAYEEWEANKPTRQPALWITKLRGPEGEHRSLTITLSPNEVAAVLTAASPSDDDPIQGVTRYGTTTYEGDSFANLVKRFLPDTAQSIGDKLLSQNSRFGSMMELLIADAAGSLTS